MSKPTFKSAQIATLKRIGYERYYTHTIGGERVVQMRRESEDGEEDRVFVTESYLYQSRPEPEDIHTANRPRMRGEL